MTVKAYAKINIGLQIVNKRDDGYHNIDTIFHRIDLHDTLHFQRREHGVTLSTNHKLLPTNDTNLCIQACRKLFERVGYDGGVHIQLEKRIPFGAGLGGGSSDAASTLKAVNELFNLGLNRGELREIARSIGADVPYFIEEGSAYAKGVGDTLSYFNLDIPFWILLVNPGINVSTPWAYKNFQVKPSLPTINLQQLLQDNIANPRLWVKNIRNDFEPIVFGKHIIIKQLHEALYRAGALFALLSGSGSSVFGLFETEQQARETAELFSGNNQFWITAPGFTVKS